MAGAAPLRDPERLDMRPVAGSGVEHRGVRFFVPWGLFAAVGEWHFFEDENRPGIVPDYHWYMQPPYLDRRTYIEMPRFPLFAAWAKPDDYKPGLLEDWCDGALLFSGHPAVVPPEPLVTGDWYHLVAETDRANSSARIFLNGVPAGGPAVNAAASLSNPAPVEVGRGFFGLIYLDDLWPLLTATPGAPLPHDSFAYYRASTMEAFRHGPWKLFVAGTEKGKLYHLDSDLHETAGLADPFQNPDGDASAPRDFSIAP